MLDAEEEPRQNIKKKKKVKKVKKVNNIHLHINVDGGTTALMETVRASVPMAEERSMIHDCRISGEWLQIQKENPLSAGVIVEPLNRVTDGGETQWRATLEATNRDSPNHGKVFEAWITFPGLYPFRPPHVQIIFPPPGPLDHKGIRPNGRALTHGMVCFHCDNAMWNPVVTVAGVLAEVQTFL